jgi:hypothetical protein
MRKSLIALAAAILAFVTVAMPEAADAARRARAPYYSPEISHNQITPYYVGYYGSRYSHYRPDPVPSGNSYRPYPRVYKDGCWRYVEGVIFWACYDFPRPDW